MLLYRMAKMLMYMLICMTGLCLLAASKNRQCVAVAFVLVPVCLLLYWLQRRLWRWANQRLPLNCVQATLVNHRQVYEGRMPAYKASFLTFETEHGERIEFEVSREEFERIRLGAKGPLEYRGRLYVSFRKQPTESI